MILDFTNNLEKYKSLSQKEAGKYEVVENEIFVLVNKYKTKAVEDCRLEAHKKFIDIQIMIKGNEKIGYTLLNNQIPSVEYSDENDVMFFDSEYDLFSLNENMFALFFPYDIHMPGIVNQKAEDITKIVMKVKYDLD
jgi:YhcH/YjgK/YiaL family protein